MNLNLGCADKIMIGCINVDKYPFPGVDLITDLTVFPWPWEDNQIEAIIAEDIIEHLPDKIATMNEIYRILAPGGWINIALPTTNGMGAYQDPTHVSYWNLNSFKYYEDKNPYRERFAKAYGIKARFKTLRHSLCVDYYGDGERLDILLEAVKDVT